MAVSVRYIEDKCRVFLKEEYNIDLDVPVIVNNKLKNTYGNVNYFINCKEDVIVKSIEFHGGILKTNRYDNINNLIKHECIHYALIKQKKGFKDTDLDFNKELERLGVGSCDLTLDHNFYIFECKNCNKIVKCSMINSNKRCNTCDTELTVKKVKSKMKEMKIKLEDSL